MQAFILSVADLLGRPGVTRDIRLTGELPDVSTTLASLSSAPVTLDGRAESVIEGILVTGRTDARADLECARCLKGFHASVELDVCELFYAPGHDQAEEDSYRVTDSEVHLEPMLRDAIALSLPLNPVCDDACKGICAHCGRDLNDGACGCGEEEPDPRWAPLAALRERMEG